MNHESQNNKNSENIKVSVILPVYNPGGGIERCIKSLREQTLRKIEIIFVDDCGTDASMEKVHAAAEEDPRIRVIRNEKNSGPGFSRNVGIEAARGEYLQFTDPDDFLDIEYLEELYRYAFGQKLDIVKGKFIFDLEDGSQLYRKEVNAHIKKGLLEGYPLFMLLASQHQSCLVRRGLLMKYHIRYGNSYCGQDSTFLLRLGYADASFGLCETTAAYHYVFRNNSLVNQFYAKNLLSRLDGFREQIDFLLDQNFDQYAERFLLIRAQYLLWMHSKAASFPELNETTDVFLQGLREQIMRCPLSDSFIKSSLCIRGLIKYEKNLSLRPYFIPFYRRGIGEYLRTWLHLAGFLCRHPGEFSAVSAEFLKTIQSKLAKKAS